MSQTTLDQSITHSQGEKEIQPIVPMSRVKTIMKSSPEVTNINSETLYIVCKATVIILLY